MPRGRPRVVLEAAHMCSASAAFARGDQGNDAASQVRTYSTDAFFIDSTCPAGGGPRIPAPRANYLVGTQRGESGEGEESAMPTRYRLMSFVAIAAISIVMAGCGQPAVEQSFADSEDHPKRTFEVAATDEQRFGWALPNSFSLGNDQSVSEGVAFAAVPAWTPREDLLKDSRIAAWEPVEGGVCIVAVWPNDLGGFQRNVEASLAGPGEWRGGRADGPSGRWQRWGV